MSIMPNIKVVYWNIESFGDDLNGRRGDYVPLNSFIVEVIKNIDADIFCIMEFRKDAFRTPLFLLHQALLKAYEKDGNPTCDWYVDFVPGALLRDSEGFSPFNRVGFTSTGRQEGYAVFWKQNIDKFIMQVADPIDEDALGVMGGSFADNLHSDGVRMRAAPEFGGINVPISNIEVPETVGGSPVHYILPVGTVLGANGILLPNNSRVNSQTLDRPLPLPPGSVLSFGTTLPQNAGLELNASTHGTNPILVPAGYSLETQLLLPAPNTVIVPKHAIRLVLEGREVVDGRFKNYQPGAANHWTLLKFPGTAGALSGTEARRPAYCTIRIPTTNRLIPIINYHTPAAPRSAKRAMEICAKSRPLYETFDFQQNKFRENNGAIVGGDFNSKLDDASLHYRAFTDPLGAPGEFAGGAACDIRVNQPAPPAGSIIFPPIEGVPTPADNPENKSTVRLNRLHPVSGPGLPILSRDPDHYKGRAIDNIFYKGFGPHDTPRHTFSQNRSGTLFNFEADIYDLLKAVTHQLPTSATAAGGAGISGFFISPETIRLFNRLPVVREILDAGDSIPNNLKAVENLDRFLRDIAGGGFLSSLLAPDPPVDENKMPVVDHYEAPPQPILPTSFVTSQRRAAEFVRLFVSDHLPVIFTMHV